MSMNNCYTPVQLRTNFDNVFKMLENRYNKNIETTLQSEDEEFLNYICDSLNKISTSENVKFNEEGFRSLIKKLFVNDFSQFGGVGDEIVPNADKTISPPNRKDFFAIVMIFVSIFCIYISFIKFNELILSTTNTSNDELQQDVKSQIQTALSELESLPIEQLTFIQYIYNSIKTFSCSIVTNQRDRLTNMVQKVLTDIVWDFAAQAEKICMPRNEIIKEGAYNVAQVDLGKTFNYLIQGVSSYRTGGPASSCITNTVMSLQHTALTQMFNQKTIILNQILAQSASAADYLKFGAWNGGVAIMYLGYRTKEVIGITYKNYRKDIKKVTDALGGRKHRTKKSKKGKKGKKGKKTLKRIRKSGGKKSKTQSYNF